MIRCAFAAVLPQWQGEIALELPPGATAGDALAAAKPRLPPAAIDEQFWASAPLGIFGESCGRDRVLQEGDRVEIYRPLAVDPKAARRARATENQTWKARNQLTAKPQRRG